MRLRIIIRRRRRRMRILRMHRAPDISGDVIATRLTTCLLTLAVARPRVLVPRAGAPPLSLSLACEIAVN